MQLILLVVAIVFAILAPIAAQLLYFAISRKREYLADATGTRLTRYPEGLASALEKLSKNTAELPVANKVTAGMYIVNPLKKEGMKLSDLTSTHPPISERVKILRSMAGGAGYLDYQNAFNSVKGSSSVILPPSALKDTSGVDIRQPGETLTQANARQQKRTLGDLMMTVSNFAFITCICGLKIKMPPDFKKPEVICPKCGTVNKVMVK
jgi:heat shock protein HtpX